MNDQEIQEIIKQRMERRKLAQENAAMATRGSLGKRLAGVAIGLGAGFSDALTGKDRTSRVVDLLGREETARLKALESDDSISDLMDLYKIQQTGNLQRELVRMREAGDLQGKLLDLEKSREQAEREQARFDKKLQQDANQFYAKLRADQEAAKKAPTEGEKTIDREFGKKVVNWNATGRAEYKTNMAKLKRALEILEAKKDDFLGVTGKKEGIVPKLFRSSENIAAQQDVEQVATASLRAALGAQFTEKEGERIMAQSFDKDLEEEQNIQKIKDTIATLEERARALDDMNEFFKKNRSLRGYTGKTFGNFDGGGRVMVTNGQETLEIDASDLAEAQRDGFRVVQ